jgi:hypothetical protein
VVTTSTTATIETSYATENLADGVEEVSFNG